MGFEVLIRKQREHFWYRGRHILLLNILKKEVSQHFGQANNLRAIDMGGGCGGWLEYIHTHNPGMFIELALGDSSMRSLSLAEPVLGSFARRYQIDLLNLAWDESWDVVFLLNVLEHISNHEKVLQQIHQSMRQDGLLFVTTPALKFFWTYNDDLALYQRRYSRQDFQKLAEQTKFELLRTNYFIFFLSPALLLSRMLFRPPKLATQEQIKAHLIQTHHAPSQPINGRLQNYFRLKRLRSML